MNTIWKWASSHMNGRLYDPLLRRFLNADENIQDPFNTQIYNRYGYVMNNPLLYNDPDGEFWILLGAVAGAYFTGVKANGSWNPVKWNWGATRENCHRSCRWCVYRRCWSCRWFGIPCCRSNLWNKWWSSRRSHCWCFRRSDCRSY